MKYDAIFVVLPRGTAEHVMNIAKEAGAQGGTILLARGTGLYEAKTFFGLTVDVAKEVLFVLTQKEDTERILEAIVKAGHLEKPGRGIAFVMNIDRTVGLVNKGEFKSVKQ
ncbi:MAG: P-II family nitrogen regulator [Firmicutes bacterium]|jgi:nitrogen regulatory protein P-II 1|nr:P-II family nitrogen regulator [Bacillota bacterium]